MNTIGIVAGSYDPVTFGHRFLFEEAARLVDRLLIVVGVNPAKKYMFSENERAGFLEAMLPDMDLSGTPVEIHFIRNKDLLVQFAASHGVTHLFRGIRNAADFGYETEMEQVNRKVNPAIRTVFMTSPANISVISSSTIKSLVGHTDWESIVRADIHPSVVDAFKRKLEREGQQ